MKSGKEFYKSFLHTTSTLLTCRDSKYLNETDRKDIARHKGSLERENVDYLLSGADCEITELIQNEDGIPVTFARFEYNFGNLFLDRIPALELHEKVESFVAHRGRGIFVLLFGVVNHWISLVVNKTGVRGAPAQIFVLDSSNI